MNTSPNEKTSVNEDLGRGMMEVILGVLIILILGSILLHLIRLGYNMYRLNNATQEIAGELEKAKEIAQVKNQDVGVIFEARNLRYGIDRNFNGRLESGEASDLPDGVRIAEDGQVIFTRTGSLAKGSKEPKIQISNSRGSRSVSVSSHGAIQIE
jgi:hypothetical protein